MSDPCPWWPVGNTSEGTRYQSGCGPWHWVEKTDRQPKKCPYCDRAIKRVMSKADAE